jgi:hypothetical protein
MARGLSVKAYCPAIRSTCFTCGGTSGRRDVDDVMRPVLPMRLSARTQRSQAENVSPDERYLHPPAFGPSSTAPDFGGSLPVGRGRMGSASEERARLGGVVRRRGVRQGGEGRQVSKSGCCFGRRHGEVLGREPGRLSPNRDVFSDQLTRFLRSTHELCGRHRDVATASLLENWIDEAERRV